MSINTTRHEVPEICNAVLDRNCYNRRRPLFTFRLTDLTKHNLDICTVPNITVRILVIHYILHPNLEGKKSIQHFIFFSLSRSLFFFSPNLFLLLKLNSTFSPPRSFMHSFFYFICIYAFILTYSSAWRPLVCYLFVQPSVILSLMCVSLCSLYMSVYLPEMSPTDKVVPKLVLSHVRITCVRVF